MAQQPTQQPTQQQPAPENPAQDKPEKTTSDARGAPMANGRKRGVPEGLWIRCPQCKATIFRKEAESRFNVCPECEYHFYVPAKARIAQMLDGDSFEEWFADLSPCDPLGFKDRILYAER
jgi:acetyl-CoA carboxylase carboxyl transferase subunit beta